MTQNGLTMIKISHFKIQQQNHPEITLAVAKNRFLTSNEASPRVSETTARFPSKFSWSLPFESLNLDSKWRSNLKLKLKKKKWTNFVLNSENFQISTPLPRHRRVKILQPFKLKFRCFGLVRSRKNTNLIWNLIGNDISDSTVKAKFPFEDCFDEKRVPHPVSFESDSTTAI